MSMSFALCSLFEQHHHYNITINTATTCVCCALIWSCQKHIHTHTILRIENPRTRITTQTNPSLFGKHIMFISSCVIRGHIVCMSVCVCIWHTTTYRVSLSESKHIYIYIHIHIVHTSMSHTRLCISNSTDPSICLQFLLTHNTLALPYALTLFSYACVCECVCIVWLYPP